MSVATTPMNDALAELVARFERRGDAISVNFRRMLPELNNADRATHLLHPYPAKLLVHIPHFFLNCPSLSKPGDRVLDPFCGSGTVLLEAQLAGRSPLGADVNPLARLITRVKTTPLNPRQLLSVLTRLLDRVQADTRNKSLCAPDIPNLDHWFYPHVVRDLCRIRDAIGAIRSAEMRDFFRICLSVTSRKASLADPRLTVPVRLRPTKYPHNHPMRAKLTRHLGTLRVIDTVSLFQSSCEVNIDRMSRMWDHPHPAAPATQYHEARFLCNGRRLRASSIQLAITSPPYPGAQKYIRSSMFGLGWLGLCSAAELIDHKRAVIGREEVLKADAHAVANPVIPAAKRILSQINERDPVRATIAATYLADMHKSLLELARVVRPGGHLVLVVANGLIGRRRFPTVRFLEHIAMQVGFRVRLQLIDTIKSRGLMTKRNRTASMMSREWVILFERGD